MPSTKVTLKIFEGLLSAIISMVFGAVVTSLVFSFTSPPVVSGDVRRELSNDLLALIKKNTGENWMSSIAIDSAYSVSMDIGQGNTIFIYGSVVDKSKVQSSNNKGDDEVRMRRVWAIFDPSSQGLFDKLVGRPGLYKISSYGFADVGYRDELSIKKVSEIDVDGIGGKAILAEIESQYADRTSRTFMLMQRDIYGKWVTSSIPPMADLISGIVSGKIKLNDYGIGPIPSYCCFGGLKDNKKQKLPDVEKIVGDGIYEDLWSANIDGISVDYSSVSNGGYYVIDKHSERGHVQAFVLLFSTDDRAVQSSHYAIASMLSLKEGKFTFDDLWNWGRPMVSIKPVRLSEIDRKSIMKAGIEAHIVNDTFFGYTEFGKRRSEVTH